VVISKKKIQKSCHIWQKKKRLLSYGWILSQQLLELPAFFPHTRTKMSMPLVNCIVNDGLVNAMPNMQKTLLQFTTLLLFTTLLHYNTPLQAPPSRPGFTTFCFMYVSGSTHEQSSQLLIYKAFWIFVRPSKQVTSYCSPHVTPEHMSTGWQTNRQVPGAS